MWILNKETDKVDRYLQLMKDNLSIRFRLVNLLGGKKLKTKVIPKELTNTRSYQFLDENRFWKYLIAEPHELLNMHNELFSYYVFLFENYTAKKKLMLKKAQGLYDLDDEEYLPDEKSDFLSDLFYEETRQQIYNNLTSGEIALIDALLDAKGNVAKAARIMGIDESKARRMRKAIQKKCDFLEK